MCRAILMGTNPCECSARRGKRVVSGRYRLALAAGNLSCSAAVHPHARGCSSPVGPVGKHPGDPTCHGRCRGSPRRATRGQDPLKPTHSHGEGPKGRSFRLQLISVRDNRRVRRIAFGRPDQFLGRTVEIAGGILPPPQIAGTFSRACGLPASRPADTHRAGPRLRPQLAQMFTFFNDHLRALPTSRAAGEHPDLMTLETWLRATEWKP